jgi:hypothetical protein
MVRTLPAGGLLYWFGGSHHVDRSDLCDHGFARRLGASGGLRRHLKIQALLRHALIQRRAHFSYIQPTRGFAMSSPDDDVCPVRDELLGELYHANDRFMPGFVSTLAPDIRASLALFCYRRNHLHSMGLAIAASCNEADLVRDGQLVGKVRQRPFFMVVGRGSAAEGVPRRLGLVVGVELPEDRFALRPALSPLSSADRRHQHQCERGRFEPGKPAFPVLPWQDQSQGVPPPNRTDRAQDITCRGYREKRISGHRSGAVR